MGSWREFPEKPIVGVGGVFNAEDAWEKIMAGASLLQVYTGLVYEGPGIVKEIVKGVLEKLEQAGMQRVEQAVGHKPSAVEEGISDR